MPRSLLRLLASSCLAAALAATPALAHDDPEGVLARIDAALAETPGDASLWQRRAALERAAGNFERSRGDLERARALGLPRALVARERGLTALAEGRVAAAERELRRARTLAPADLETLVAHAECLGALLRWREAADAYARVIELAPSAGPDLHLARVRALAALGDGARALAAVEAARARLGPVPALEQEGIALELHAGRTDAALARLDRLAATAARREHWLLQRGEILERAGRTQAAAHAYGEALASLESRPQGRRATPAAVDLARRARAGVLRTTAGDRR